MPEGEEKVERQPESEAETESESEDLREELYNQFDVSPASRIGIQYILPALEGAVETESTYDISKRSEILAEIALFQAYRDAPKIKIFAWAAVLIGTFDLLHPLNPDFYSILFLALATINGFVSSLRSPSMMAAELEGATDEDGMPADYRAKAFSSVNTNVTLVLFVIAVGIQLIMTGGLVEGEVISRNIAQETLNPLISGLILIILPVIWDRVR